MDGSVVAADESCQTGCAARTNRLLKVGIIGTVITALCCFTPVLVVLFGVLGLAGLVGYLDYVLFPLLGVFILLGVVGAIRFSAHIGDKDKETGGSR
jgi:mercuric ion transport protein